MTSHVIANARLSVAVATGYGARVTSLRHIASGRDWMTQGGESPQTGDDAVYLGDEAVAWDECFPTVGRCNVLATAWGRTLRDHGELWGRPWQVDHYDAETLALSFTAPEFVFERHMRLEGPTLVIDYAVTNRLAVPLPYLWALHALLAVRPGDRMDIPGLESVGVSYLGHQGQTIALDRAPFAGSHPELPFRLDTIQPPDADFAAKLIAKNLRAGTARIGQPGQWLDLSWDSSIADLGIWITYGAWQGHTEVAIEPTSAPANDLVEAITSGARPLAPGERRAWTVGMTVGA